MCRILLSSQVCKLGHEALLAISRFFQLHTHNTHTHTYTHTQHKHAHTRIHTLSHTKCPVNMSSGKRAHHNSIPWPQLMVHARHPHHLTPHRRVVAAEAGARRGPTKAQCA